ncbi:adhesin [Pradoshia eiseniae]|mgnify:FL=1|uniref:Adhesin n=1 Tax=Pradoshia eiseniae TaxID=2064768 RepID=A0A2S7MW22_9BACI|nr:zinc ABC transporter substrate-binding protein [Pradoshia eiseniae]PQD94011.1 adhesin [Pradoshia eiseniae]
MRKLTFIFALILTASVFLAGCGSSSSETKKDDNKITIYTTVYPLQYFAEQIGGDYVDVNSVYPAGVDEHTFEPTQKDIINIAEADLFYYIGYNLEGFVTNAKKTLKNENVDMIAIGEEVHIGEDSHTAEEHNHEEEDDHGHEHGSTDPHLWIDPVYAKEMAELIKDSLSSKLPEQSDTFESNYEALAEKLDNLNEDYSKTIENAKHSEFLVSHAAFGYWTSRYGLDQISISGISTSEEPSQKSLQNLVEKARKYNLKYLLVEQNVSSKLTNVIKNEAKLTTLPIHNLATLTQDDIDKDRDYFSIMEDNLESLNTALN